MTDKLPVPWERLAAPEPWEAALLTTGPLPAEPKDVIPWAVHVAGIESSLLRVPELKRELLLQVWKLGPKHGAEILEENAGPWWPQLGVGVWPDREPPRRWTEEMLNDAMADALNQEEIRLASHKLMTLKAVGTEQARAISLLRGHGALLQMFAPTPLSEMQDRGRALFLPLMVESRFRKARFLLPLLDSRSLASAKNGEELAQWLCGAKAYLRESAEDHGVLLIADMPLGPLIRSVSSLAESDAGRI